MEPLTLQTNDRQFFEKETLKLFNLIRLDNPDECFELISGKNQEILPGLTLKVDDKGNGILELSQKFELDVKMAGKRVEEVAQFQGNDLITIGDKDFLLILKEEAVINSKAGEFEIPCNEEPSENVEGPEDELLEIESGKMAGGEHKEYKMKGRKKIFSLFFFGMTCMIIASFSFLLFMNSKISDFHRMTDMANIFQRKMAQRHNYKPQVVVKHVPIVVQEIVKEGPAPQPVVLTTEKKRKVKVVTSKSDPIYKNKFQATSSRLKPTMVIGQKDRERVLKEIEMLKLEYRLDPYSVRKSLQEMRDSLGDQSLRKKIVKVLQRL